jgi:hypothetical protein
MPYPVQIVESQRGRARQLNAGARHARGDWYLFLHVDSHFENRRGLMLSLAAMQREHEIDGQIPVAGHFPLHFSRSDSRASLAYFYYESKSRLDLQDCIHGDQGFFMHRDTFELSGGFNEQLLFLEDAQMADSISKLGRWVLLPVDITTSARRFEAEGLFQRQVLNALIMNFRSLGWDRFFKDLPGIYRSQADAERLELLPFWVSIRCLLRDELPSARMHIWYGTGNYVRSQAWQLLFFWHCRRQFRRGQSVTMGRHDIQEGMRSFNRMTDNPLGNWITSLLVWIWFYLTYAYLLGRRKMK